MEMFSIIFAIRMSLVWHLSIGASSIFYPTHADDEAIVMNGAPIVSRFLAGGVEEDGGGWGDGGDFAVVAGLGEVDVGGVEARS